MTALSSSAPQRFSGRRAQSISKTSVPAALYRDVPLGVAPASLRLARFLPFAAADAEQTSHALLLGLSALTVSAVAFSLTQLWTLMSGETLTQAIRAFLP